MRAQAQSYVVASLVGLGLCASGCGLLLGLDEFTDTPPGDTGGGAGGSGGEDSACAPDASEACYAGPPATRSEGACREGTRTCNADGTWGACEGEVLPALERCDAADDENCDALECIVWATAYAQTGDVYPMAVASDAEGNVLVSAAFYDTITIGDSTLSSANTTDALLLKLDPAGVPVWARQFGDSSADNPWALAVDSKGNVVLAGESIYGGIDFGDGPLPPGAFIARFNPAGEHTWSKGLGGGLEGVIPAVAIDANDDVVVAGSFSGPIDFGGGPISPEGVTDIIVAKLDGATGSVTAPGCWARSFGGADPDNATAVAVDRSNNIFVAGVSSGIIDFGGLFEVEKSNFVVKFTPAGAATGWVRRMTGATPVAMVDITVDASGRPVVAGHYTGELQIGPHSLMASGESDTFVVQLEADSTVGWVRAFGGTGNQVAGGIAMDPFGDIVLVGHATKQLDLGDGPLAVEDRQAFVAKLTPDAGLVWSRLLGTDAVLSAVATSSAGETLVAGYTTSSHANFGTGPLPGTGDGSMQRLVVAKLGR
ncbi:hypothetical protein SOCE26_041530 [Sorangium cellulosum]|uniref:Uncharacterized protein n=2 Tax=Sorangium cellulosum TaxID=56 RepID=A0A2L0ETV5_SORCE|nr:hypothetical protein SOCE26_041530 [Sorangium cellulosum]